MIRNILAGGQVVSFALPYVDPETGTPFVRWTTGLEAMELLRSRVPLQVECPGHPDREAEFDEDPEGYFCFLEDFCVSPPAHVVSVIDALMIKEKRRQVEKELTREGMIIYIRRPIDDGFRWRTLLAGIEGRVQIDFDATPTWTGEGLRQLVAALSREAEAVRALELTHMPLALLQQVSDHADLSALLVDGTVRIHTRCDRCEAPRRVAVHIAAFGASTAGSGVPPPTLCPSCGHELVMIAALPSRGPSPEASQAGPPPTGGVGAPADPVRVRDHAAQAVRSLTAPTIAGAPFLLWVAVLGGLLFLVCVSLVVAFVGLQSL